jgi:hypothetical protein
MHDSSSNRKIQILQIPTPIVLQFALQQQHLTTRDFHHQAATSAPASANEAG